ncbi:MAG: deoxynucleoside kinase [Bacteroidales bacterium]|nr:deoxynucleoside kinase [Bacteroidales bacterium]
MTTSLLKYNFIVIEGNIGAGKTTLAKRLSEEFNARLILERFEDNSFLPKFYEQPDIYAFPLEMSFLADRYQQLKEKLAMQELFKTITIADYFIDKSLIFAKNNLKADEFNLYSRLFQIISTFLPRPDLLVYLYLDIPRLKENINKRGRDYERLIQDDYLGKIQAGYLNHFRSLNGLRILIIDTNKADFMENEKDYQAFLKVIGTDYDIGIHRVFI